MFPGNLGLSVAEEVLVPCRGSSRSRLKELKWYTISSPWGSTTPPPMLPSFFSTRSPSLLPSRSRARSLDGPFRQLKPKESTERWLNIVRHNAVACTGPALRAQREYVVHKSNWTMIDDVTFLPLSLSLVSSFALCYFFSLSLSVFFPLCHFER